MISVTMISKDDCQLCDEALQYLDDLQKDIEHELEIINIEGNPELEKKYALDIPVIEVGPYRLKAPFSAQDLEITLRAAAEREKNIAEIDKKVAEGEASIPVTITRGDRFSYWMSRHYMLVLNAIVLIYVGLPFLAPFLMSAGYTRPATTIYRFYGLVCHQLAFRSWFIFGDQAAYPREAAGVDSLIPFGVATGLSEENELAARQFVGNQEVGYKVALCERDVAIYGGILLFGIIFSLSGRRIKHLPWYLWLLVGILPIALDGFSQLLSQPPLNMFPYRESTPLLRTVTGFLFGFTTAWFGYPIVEESMADVRRYYEQKLARACTQAEAKRKGNALPPT
ncbi:MAG: DUF2085 domain-containing protein [Chloroflexota bacterium]|nr:MAG: DUF2085 domain-containing protein [Chloroflexota bacterium]